MPYLTGMAGLPYLAVALVLDSVFLRYAWRLRTSEDGALPMRTFRWSVNYLALLFATLLIDHYLPPLGG